MAQTILLTAICIGLLIFVLLFLAFGCVCIKPNPVALKVEGFENAEDAEEKKVFETDHGKETALTELERELFEDLKTNKLKDKDINELIKSGTLNEETIEKFLMALNTNVSFGKAMKGAGANDRPEVEGFEVGGNVRWLHKKK